MHSQVLNVGNQNERYSEKQMLVMDKDLEARLMDLETVARNDV